MGWRSTLTSVSAEELRQGLGEERRVGDPGAVAGERVDHDVGVGEERGQLTGFRRARRRVERAREDEHGSGDGRDIDGVEPTEALGGFLRKLVAR